MTPFPLKIVTLDGLCFDGEAEEIIVRTTVGDMGVLEEKRGRGFGDLLIRLLLYKSLTHSASQICLETPKELEGFFARYGFLADGEENGLVQMHIMGDDVQLSHCGGNCAECGHRSPECVPKALREE